MILQDKLKKHRILLASGSPRRQQFFKDMGLPYEVRLKPIDEIHPPELKASEISDFLSELKASAFVEELEPNDILITSDTVVWHNNQSLAKANTKEEAMTMLRQLSNDWHEVITSVTFTTLRGKETVNRVTRVKFKSLSEEEIEYYVTNYEPFDKAGAYGIQEWIGLIGIEEIRGPYTNVVGLPTQLVYETLMRMVE